MLGPPPLGPCLGAGAGGPRTGVGLESGQEAGTCDSHLRVGLTEAGGRGGKIGIGGQGGLHEAVELGRAEALPPAGIGPAGCSLAVLGELAGRGRPRPAVGRPKGTSAEQQQDEQEPHSEARATIGSSCEALRAGA